MSASTPVVFLHAFPLNAAMWRDQLEALPDRRTLAPHFPGFGGRSPVEADVDAFARVVLADMDQEGVERAVVVGLSMGGYVAFRLQALAPERVAGLVLADTRAGADTEEVRTRRTEQASRARRQGVGWLGAALVPALVGATTLQERPDVVRRVTDLVADADAEGVARALEAMRERPDSTSQLAGIEVPVLCLVGDEDTPTPVEEARRIAEGVVDGRMVILAGAGHLSNLEAPDAFNEALLDFLDR